MGLGLTNAGNPFVGLGPLKLALVGRELEGRGVDPVTAGPDDGLGTPPLNEGCVWTNPCVAWIGLVTCCDHHEPDVDWSPVSLFESKN